MDKIDSIVEHVKKLGLTENESKVYCALLEMGARSAGTISRRTDLHRRVIYDVLDRLIKKGLVGYMVQNGKKVFSASNPNRFYELIDEKKKEADIVVPSLIDFYNSEKNKQREDTLFFKGINGLKSVFEDQINDGNEILILGSSTLANEYLEYYFHWFDKRRVKKKIKARIVFSGKKEKKKIPFSDVRYIPEEYGSPLAINVYGEKVAMIVWRKDNPFCVLIKNKETSEGYRKYFELAWNSARKL